MYYFIGIGIPSKLTGVDKAQYNRLALFKDHQMEAKILTVQYNHLGSLWARQNGIELDVINMYDYFQKIDINKTINKFNFFNYWNNHPDYEVKILSNYIDVKVLKNNRMIMYARFADKKLEQLLFLNHFNIAGQFVKHEEYDIRGFLSSVCHYKDNQTVYQEFLTPQGEKVIEKYFSGKEKNPVPTAIYLKNKQGIFERFDDEDTLIAYFLETIYQSGDCFIIDRPLEVVPPVLKINKNIPTAVVLHMTHISETDSKQERLKWPYALLFENLKHFDALICSTEAQKRDIESFIEKFHPEQTIPVFNIPVGFTDTILASDYKNKNPFQIISIARYVEGKNLHHQINLVHKLKKDFADVTLDLYGFGSQHLALQSQIDSLNAGNYIKLRGFVTNLNQIYETSSLSLLTSHSEGFALAILESLSHHTPVIAFNVKYGPDEMIQDGVNGNLIQYNNIDELYEKVKLFLSNQELQHSYFENCAPSISQYHSAEVYKKWLQLLKNITL